MAVVEISPARSGGAKLERPLDLICFALIVANAVYLIASYFQGSWLVGADGQNAPTDFLGVWAAGHLVLTGHAAAAYDWPAHKVIEDGTLGHGFGSHGFAGYFGWHYPPTFLFVAAALALLPYASAGAVWVFATFPAYLAAMRAIIGNRTGYLLAAAFPAVLANFVAVQNGFLSAALIGGALAIMQRRPLLAGVLIGLLTYKPHLGLLFPIALAAAGYWRVFVTAGVVAVLMALASWLAFGNETWIAFAFSLGHTSHVFLSEGAADWSKLQTAFGLTRTLGGTETLAWSAQIAVGLAATGAVAALWRSNAAYEIKAATLVIGALLATPYLYTYDLVVLAIPLAFLFRLGSARGFLKQEWAGMGAACGLVLIFPFVKAPVGFVAILIVAALLARRTLMPVQRVAI